MTRSPIITVSRGRFSSTATQVLEQVRAAGRASRDEIAAATGLSIATVGRTAALLVERGLLRERPDLARPGVTGRPGVPVEIDTDHYVTIGVHVGRRIATVALGDLTGRVLASQTVRRPLGTEPDLEQLSREAATLLGSHPGRVPLAAGLVAPWREIGLVPTEREAELHELTGLPVRTGDHISAVAAAEFLHRRDNRRDSHRESQGDSHRAGHPDRAADAGGLTLYLYARDTFGWSVAVDRGVQTDVTRAASLAHFPTGADVPCPCGRSGCLAAAIDVLPDVERARTLGATAGSVRDMLSPDQVVLVGQAFTGDPGLLDVIVAAYEAHSALERPVPVSFTRFGSDIQAISACTVALGPVLDDPLACVEADGACRRRRGA
ncbi:helix-turn-helix domain-containing protein [Nocardioides carbamazepini]|uniref:ROK family transcriptional regulator n=1 Tax=Nocardioides carbamazepini TaxID=2854259 RepID=UPI00214A1B66|nr:ROK family transcriptional regulator [Nocardioides carbamazepini]MCR1781125.1 helix-turn-helix domain-containing protein [Nocardioides carbamazepini]